VIHTQKLQCSHQNRFPPINFTHILFSGPKSNDRTPMTSEITISRSTMMQLTSRLNLVHAVAALLLASACSAPDTTYVATSATSVPSGDISAVSNNDGTGTTTLTVVGGASTDYAHAAGASLAGFTAFSGGAGNVVGQYAEGTSGDTYVVVGATTTGTAPFSGTLYGRNSAGNLPIIGNAGYSGNYAALFVSAATPSNAASMFDGTFAMDLNFESGILTGTISDRDVFNTSGSSASQTANSITLSGNMTGGEFSGTTTGGETASSSTSGTFSGLLGGTLGSEVVGATSITHTVGGISFTEIGVFLGTKD
jgi:hypothetical protein